MNEFVLEVKDGNLSARLEKAPPSILGRKSLVNSKQVHDSFSAFIGAKKSGTSFDEFSRDEVPFFITPKAQAIEDGFFSIEMKYSSSTHVEDAPSCIVRIDLDSEKRGEEVLSQVLAFINECHEFRKKTTQSLRERNRLAEARDTNRQRYEKIEKAYPLIRFEQHGLNDNLIISDEEIDIIGLVECREFRKLLSEFNKKNRVAQGLFDGAMDGEMSH